LIISSSLFSSLVSILFYLTLVNTQIAVPCMPNNFYLHIHLPIPVLKIFLGV